MLRLEYSEELRPTGEHGREVLSPLAGPIPSNGAKDAAGYYFHLKALQQSGLWGECSFAKFFVVGCSGWKKSRQAGWPGSRCCAAAVSLS